MRVQAPVLTCLLGATLVAGLFIRRPARGSDVLYSVPLIDGHNDLPYNLRSLVKNQLANFNFSANLSDDPYWGNVASSFTDLPRLRAGRVGAQFWVAYVGCSSQFKDAVEQTLEQVDVIKRLINAYPDDLQLATSANDIWKAFNSGKIASLIAVEGGHSLDNRLAILRLMHELGVRYVTLTHSCNTPWGDSSPADDINSGVPAEHNGLTDYGKVVVKEMNRLGIMVDLSHVAYKVMVDAINVSVAPVIFSHSSAYAVCSHHRNVRDDVLRMVRDNGGIVMVNFYSGFINCTNAADATLDDVVDHINHIRVVAGVDHVGIGSDYDGVDRVPTGLEDVSKYPDLFDRLANSRPWEPEWSTEDLEKLAGLNLIRVLEEVEKVRDELAAQALKPYEEHLAKADLGDNTRCITDNFSFS
ncbi:dipeptidase 1-like [Zootermopsis nevadensis]|uniref:Dipeptidase n=1 Tax=Zootermopsis nevadensis TaxID=136037 RepID=A0A067RD78_ZOONE|nr:dipeptidase 1-like [Zootermopsis nevadensis]XP_021925032.1 dipeptidase 1-like [Zootermopsis nevadensis]KDR16715.1 Dipeptidase 1 [Zootermopsis nevadensis]